MEELRDPAAPELDADAALLARINALMSTRRQGGRRITKAAIRAQSANYSARAARESRRAAP